ncbi:MAG: 30S ribosomal protein S17 [Legionellales bacterium]|nr:30S ribosomal protein S17 [Legionellales bacterium]
MTELKSNARTMIGKVVSDKMQSTAVVLVERYIKHPKYGKFIKKSTKLHVHSEGEYSIGDKVKIVETKPYSKTKFWKILDKVN